MMRMAPAEIERRAEALRPRLEGAMEVELRAGESVFGGGSAPGATLPTHLLTVRCPGIGADELTRRLRSDALPVIARVEDDRVVLDLRTVFPEQDVALAGALLRAASGKERGAET